MTQPDSIRFDQTVHGYKGGHRLLQSSVRLSHSANRLMLLLSDLSGSGIVKGFESYLTGYPIYEDEVYALAKTWYADDMPRPGCVWTHTLLIHFDDIIKISDLSAIENLFERPRPTKIVAEIEPLSVPYRELGQLIPSRIKTDESDLLFAFANVVEYFYADRRPTVILCEESRRYVWPTLRFWDQQLPAMRRDFKFCTGSLSNRKFGEHSFDLQIAPNSLRGKFRDDDDLRQIFPDNQELPIELWAAEAARDLLAENSPRFKGFIWTFADDLETRSGTEPDERTHYLKLAKLFALLRKQDPNHQGAAAKVAQILGREFPKARSAAELKLSLFGEYREALFFPELQFSETQKLSALISTKKQSAFASPEFSVRERAGKLLRDDRAGAIRLTRELLKNRQTRLAAEFLDGISVSANLETIVEIVGPKREQLFEFFERNEDLLLDPSVWQLEIDIRDLFEFIVSKFGKSIVTMERILRQLLDAERFDVAFDAAAALGPSAVPVVLGWFDQSRLTFERMHADLRDILRKFPRSVAEWIAIHDARQETLLLLSYLISPNLPELVESMPQWSRLAGASDSLNEHDLVQARAFCLALGMNSSEGQELVSLSFQTVHDAAKGNILQHYQWQYLEEHAPSLDWFWSWDRCKRLRVALVHIFCLRDWAEQYFLDAIQDEDTWIKTVEDGRHSRKGRRFFEELSKRFYTVGFRAKEFQERTLRYLADRY